MLFRSVRNHPVPLVRAVAWRRRHVTLAVLLDRGCFFYRVHPYPYCRILCIARVSEKVSRRGSLNRCTFSSPAVARMPICGWHAIAITTSVEAESVRRRIHNQWYKSGPLWLSASWMTLRVWRSHTTNLWSSLPVIRNRPLAVRAVGMQYLRSNSQVSDQWASNMTT